MGITKAALAELSNLTGDVSSPTAFSHIALGDSNTAFAASQTALQSEITGNGLARAAATVTQQTTTETDDTTRFVHQWTVTGSETVREVGIFNDASAGTMLARKVLGTSRSLGSGDTYTYTYNIIFA